MGILLIGGQTQVRHRVGVRGPGPGSAVLSALYGPRGGGRHKYRDQPLDQSQ